MEFSIDWDFLQFFTEQDYDIPVEDVLERAVTITGYGNEVQVAKCRDYMSQTWPETGAAVLNFLQSAVAVLRGRGGLWSGEQRPSESRNR